MTGVDVLRTQSRDEALALVSPLLQYKQKAKQLLQISYTKDNTITYFIEVKKNIDAAVEKLQQEGFAALKYQIFARTKVDNDTYEVSKVSKREFNEQVPAVPTTAIEFTRLTQSFVVDDVDVGVYETNNGWFVVRCESTGTNLQAVVRTLKRVKSKSSSSSKSSSPVSSRSSKKVDKESFVLPNRVGFVKWMYDAFHPQRYANTVRNESMRSLFPHQRLIKDFVKFESPYRGVLLYHGLGVGKTCASIAAAEGFLQRNKRVFVMVPASLTQNYKNEIMQCLAMGNPSQKQWNVVSLPTANEHNPHIERIMEAYNIPYDLVKKHHRQMWFSNVTDGVPFTRRNLSWNSLSESEKNDLTAFLQDFIESKYTFISYNGATKKSVDALGARPFDDAFIVMDEAHNFISRVVNGGKVARRLFNMIMESKQSKMIFLSGTPVINHPYELCVLLNLIRGNTPVYNYTIGAKVEVPLVEDVENQLRKSGVLQYIDLVDVDANDMKIKVQLLPQNFVRGDTMPYVKGKQWGTDVDGILQRVYASLNPVFKVGKRVQTEDSTSLPVSKEDFNTMFLDESDPNNPQVKNHDMFMRRILGLVSYYKTAGEEYFPTVLPRVIDKVPMTPYQFSQYVDVRDKERRMETSKKRQNIIQGGLFAKKGTVYRAFSRMACNFTFPEYIKREFPADLKKELEKEMSINEDDEVEVDDAAINKEAQKKYETSLTNALLQLKNSPQQPLSADKLRMSYSPKFDKIVKDINDSPGSCLLYSQFRKVEGLGIMRMVLEVAGFVELAVEKRGNDWGLVNEQHVLDPQYDGKRFIVFNEDREKTDILIKIFNGAFDQLPVPIAESLNGIHANNLRGGLAKVFMISQSGAEGISLKNVRRVLITEPFWNKVRIDQVIGRAVRTGSHLALPPEDRNVQVFMYMSTFTESQLNDNFTLKKLDNGMTSDEHIFHIAEHKSKIVDQFLDMLKRASFDCLSNAKNNAMLPSGLQCYAFPINMDDAALSYIPSLDAEKTKLQRTRLDKARRIRGRAVSIAGKKYVEVEGMPGYFDYGAYKDAGVLIAAKL